MWGKRKRLQDRGPVIRVGIRPERRRRLLVSLIPVVLVLIPILAFIPWESFLGRDDVIPLLRPGIGIMGLAVVLGLSILAERQIPDVEEDGMSEGDIGTVDRVLADARSTEEQLRGYQLPEFDSGRMDSDLDEDAPTRDAILHGQVFEGLDATPTDAQRLIEEADQRAAEDRETRFKESERTDPDVIEAGVERLGDLVGRLPDE